MTTKANKEIQKALADVASSDLKLIKNGMESFRKSGSIDKLPDFLLAIDSSENSEALELGKQVLFDMKDEKGGDALFNLINDPRFKKHVTWLVSALWEAGIDCKDRLEDLVEIAANGDTSIVLEVLTVVENIDHSYPYEEITDHKLHLTEIMEDCDNEVKRELLASLCLVLDQMTE